MWADILLTLVKKISIKIYIRDFELQSSKFSIIFPSVWSVFLRTLLRLERPCFVTQIQPPRIFQGCSSGQKLRKLLGTFVIKISARPKSWLDQLYYLTLLLKVIFKLKTYFWLQKVCTCYQIFGFNHFFLDLCIDLCPFLALGAGLQCCNVHLSVCQQRSQDQWPGLSFVYKLFFYCFLPFKPFLIILHRYYYPHTPR